MNIQSHSLARMLTKMNMLVSGTALLFACLAFVGYDVLTFRERLLQSLSTQADIIGINSVSALLFDDPEAAQKTLSALRNSPNVVSSRLLTANGQLFAIYKRDEDTPALQVPSIPDERTEAHWFQGAQVLLARSIIFQGSRVGTVYIRADLKEVNGRLRQYATIAGVVLLLSLVAALLVSSIFQKAVAQPIGSLAEVARTVSRNKDYSIRAIPETSRGEVALLVDAFNEMLSEIQERDAELRKAHEELEQRVDDRTAQLAASNKELEAFSYSVSHDLRAPLRGIDGFSMALLEDYSDRLDDEGKSHLQRIRAATQRMGVLIDDLLNLSRMTRAELRKEQFNISTIAQAVASGLQEAHPDRQLEFHIQEGLEAKADSHLLRVVIENLFGNACKFTSKRPFASVEFGKTNGNGAAAYFVRDNGAGFDPAYASRLFGAFQRLHGTTEFPGTGIGLATVQRIIHRHGGQIWAEGAVEKGATFYFTLG